MKYIKGFDTLRAYSIALVVITHMGWVDKLSLDGLALLFSGGTGVQIFFTLSGFLITRILINEKERFGKIDFKIFFIRRFLRLLPPLIIFYIVIAFLMHHEMIQTTRLGLLFSFLYLYNFVPNVSYYTVELAHTWSLAVEEQFYLMWPFVINRFKKIVSVNVIIPIMIGLCILAHYLLPGFDFAKDFKTSRWFVPAVAPIMIGSFFALMNDMKQETWMKWFDKNKSILFVSAVLFIFPLYSPNVLLKLYYVVQPIGVSLFLVWILHNQRSSLTSVLDNKYTSYVGKISYGIYVYQGFFLTTGPLGGSLAIQTYPYNIVLTFLAAIVSFELVEKPILRFKRRFKRT